MVIFHNYVTRGYQFLLVNDGVSPILLASVLPDVKNQAFPGTDPSHLNRGFLQEGPYTILISWFIILNYRYILYRP